MMSDSIFISPATHCSYKEVRDEQFPSRRSSWNSSIVELPEDGTHFGYVASDSAIIECHAGTFQLKTGMYFSVPGRLTVRGEGQGFIASRVGWHGFFQIGGPTEERGRLRYIDGCSDSLLISPVVLGDPCLNLLYLPPGTTQTSHTHPSCRIGMIVGGSGVCRTPELDIPLSTGLVFTIDAESEHSFHTQNESLRVIAWHPDSDTGPHHNDHPMINRTIIDGISAAERLRSRIQDRDGDETSSPVSPQGART